MTVSFKELYNARQPVGVTNAYNAGILRDAAYSTALSDYQMLNTPTSSGPSTTLRSTRQALPMPIMEGGGGVSYKGEKVAPVGGGVAPIPYTPPGATPYNLPAYDTGKVEGLAQRFAAPGIRNLRSAVQGVQQGSYENPNVKRMTLRDSLAGYGQGLESVMAGALKEGAGIYGQQYGAEVNKAGAEFGAGESRVLQREGILSSERMQALGITSQEGMQSKSLAAQQAMHSESIAAADRLAQYNNEWRAYLASLG